MYIVVPYYGMLWYTLYGILPYSMMYLLLPMVEEL